MPIISRLFPKEQTLKSQAIAVLRKKNFDFVKTIGSGEFGEVISCKSTIHHRKVAIKIVPSRNAKEQEHELWNRVLHPNVLPLMDFMKLPEFEIFVMPLAERSLYDFMKDRRFLRKSSSFEITKNWLSGVIKGVDYLHKVGLCHLDVKIDNVLITSNKKAMLSDFSCVNTTEDKVVG